MKPIKPMLAVSGQPFSAKGWVFEPKIDGTRCIASAMNGLVLQNRRFVDITFRYPELAEALRAASDCVFDGEIAVFVDGRPDFAALSEREHLMERLRIDYLSKARPASLIVFDILFAEGESVMDRPLVERKKILQQELVESEQVTAIDYFPEKGEDYFQAALKVGIEGVMAKREDSRYQPGVRSPDWVKIKKQIKLDLVVGGYLKGKGSRAPYFGGLLLGAYRSGRLVFVGRVGSGFSEKELQMISGDFEKVPDPPFSNPPRMPGLVWLRPKSVVQVAAMEVTKDGCLRAPVYLRMRDDKEPSECTMEQMET